MTPLNPATTLHVRRFIPAPRARVFAAFINPEEAVKWMGPEPDHCAEAKIEARVGGSYSMRMRGCPPHMPEEMTVRGEYLEVRPPERLVFTWGWEGDDTPASQVTVDFFELDGGTDLHLTHERLASAESRDNHTHGWSGSIEKLRRLCAPEAPSRGAAPGPAAGEFGWNELMTTDLKAAGSFYTQLFGWSAASFPHNPDYTVFSSGKEMAAGMMKCMQPASPAYWLGYVIVADCDASAARAAELGGKVCLPPKDIPTVGRIAIITDPQGAVLGLFQPAMK